jgi:hypothetical protein
VKREILKTLLSVLLVPALGAVLWIGALGNRVAQLEGQSDQWREDLKRELQSDIQATVSRVVSDSLKAAVLIDDGVPAAGIDVPGDGEIVDMTTMVRGTSKHVPEGTWLWVFVYSYSASRYFPAARPADVQLNGAWASKVQIGNEFDDGEGFDLLVVQADPLAHSQIEAYLATRTNGMEGLPEGTVGLARIAVHRRP